MRPITDPEHAEAVLQLLRFVLPDAFEHRTDQQNPASLRHACLALAAATGWVANRGTTVAEVKKAWRSGATRIEGAIVASEVENETPTKSQLLQLSAQRTLALIVERDGAYLADPRRKSWQLLVAGGLARSDGATVTATAAGKRMYARMRPGARSPLNKA